MSKQAPMIYYYMDDHTRTIFWSEELQEDRPDLIYLDASPNQNKKMAAAAITRRDPRPSGYKIRPL